MKYDLDSIPLVSELTTSIFLLILLTPHYFLNTSLHKIGLLFIITSDIIAGISTLLVFTGFLGIILSGEYSYKEVPRNPIIILKILRIYNPIYLTLLLLPISAIAYFDLWLAVCLLIMNSCIFFLRYVNTIELKKIYENIIDEVANNLIKEFKLWDES